jgi:nucleotide-binding universal stress UspA family protein
MMFETILVATDGSHSAEKAVEFAVALAKRHDSKLVICTVTRERLAMIDRDPGEPNPIDVDPRSSLSRGQADQGAEILRRGEQAAKVAGLANYELREIYGTNTGAAIVKEAEAMRADHIVVGSVGETGLARLLMGSVAGSVVHHAHCPVTVVR